MLLSKWTVDSGCNVCLKTLSIVGMFCCLIEIMENIGILLKLLMTFPKVVCNNL